MPWAEYRETAPKFNQLGYSCLVIDQRSEMKVFGEVNETKNRAKESKIRWESVKGFENIWKSIAVFLKKEGE